MNNSAKTQRLVMLSLLGAMVAVLSVLSNFVKIMSFPITLALSPIIIGAALYGPQAGALLGGVFGVVTFATGMAGWDGGGVLLMWAVNPIALIVVCIGKGVLAGMCAGLIYRAFSKKKIKLGVVAAGIVCPVTNTGIFIIGMILFFMKLLRDWAGGSNMISFIFLTLTGVNFVVELIVNLVLSSAITTIIKYRTGAKE